MAQTQEKIHHVETLKDFKDILKNHKLVVVDFTATWCGPCQMIGPIFKELSEKPENESVTFVKVDVDVDEAKVAKFCKITSMPTFVFYKDGKEVKRFSGARKEKLIDELVNFP